jgi:hypothetical protein
MVEVEERLVLPVYGTRDVTDQPLTGVRSDAVRG